MNDFLETLLRLLDKDGRFDIADEAALRNAVCEAAMQTDGRLLSLLLGGGEEGSRSFWSEGKQSTAYDRVELVFPHKDCVLLGGQTKEEKGHEEIFYNEVLMPEEVERLFTPKVLSGAVRYTEKGAGPANWFREEDNLIIRGNNVIALASLCARFQETVQFIYIDPPYNTASSSFRYHDRFKRSTWLSFMKTRLQFAGKLLKKSGVIAIQINYIEYAYLKILCDELFGEANYLATVTVRTATTASFRAINDCPVNVSEFILIYAKDREHVKHLPVYVPGEYSEDYGSYIENYEKGPGEWKIVPVDRKIYEAEGVSSWREYRLLHGEHWKEERYRRKAEFCRENSERVVSLNTMQKPSKEILRVIEQSKRQRERIFQVGAHYVYNGRTLAFYSKKMRRIDGKKVPSEILTNIWSDISFLSLGKEGDVDFPNGKKPEKLLLRLMELFTEEGDTVLDFFLGSGTTCAVAHKKGLRYIGVEQLDYGRNDSVFRLQNVIRGERGGISRTVGWTGGGSFVYCELAKKSACRGAEGIAPEEYVSLSELEDAAYAISEEDRAFTESFYGAEAGRYRGLPREH